MTIMDTIEGGTMDYQEPAEERYVVQLTDTGFVVVDTRPVIDQSGRPQAIYHARFKAQAVADELNKP